MNKLRIISCVLLASITALLSQAQLNLPTKQIAGGTYYYYEVGNKETLYGIAQKIGVTTDEILRYNPDASGKLEKKQLLFLPVSFATGQMSPANQVRSAFGSNQEVNAPTGEAVKHTIQAGEDIYTIAKQYNTTIEGILTNNPRLSPEQYLPGQVIKIYANSALPFYYDKKNVRFYNYKVQDGETFYGIANRFGVTSADIESANPGLKKPKKGKTIVVPKVHTERVLGDMKSISLEDLRGHYEPRMAELYGQLVSNKRNSEVNIGIVLPFQLHKNAAPRQGYLYTDFYKGFLLAMDSAGSQVTKPINIHVWDTEHNLSVTDSLLALPEMQDMHLLIAPSEPKQLERLNKFGNDNNIDVVNCFTTKNNDYQENTNVIQVSTPTPQFAERVLDWFGRQFEGYNVIYLMDASNEGKEIFDNLRSHIDRMGMHTSSLTVSGDLSFDNLSRHMNPGTQYVLLPSSSSKELLRKVIKALKQAKEERFDCEFCLVGYPEYVTYLKDYQTDLQDIDTYVFSRFFNSKGFRSRDVETLYKRSFNGEILTSVPSMVLMGFDLGMYIINTLGQGINIDNDAPLYRGVQTSFKFERPSNYGGLINRAIEVVHFSTDHKITTLVQQ
ncbi:MAG: LysM peptidoglycan-binding domain-containing protein [Muribaculaceae bacterium]|nr:LysM peptidoglycan-binding domain-containing protein [Muribaculaceae bacterium]